MTIRLRHLFLLALPLLVLVTSGCSNRLADENDKLRKQALDLQREIVALKTDKKILEEKANKLTSLVPPELLPVEELVTKLPAEKRLGKIPARGDIIRYAEQNINSLVQGRLNTGNSPWKITKFTFVPPDLVYVDYESGEQKEKILLLYSLLEEEGIKTELKAYFKQNVTGTMELVRGENVEHIATPLVYTFSKEKGQWEEITRMGPASSSAVAVPTSTKTPPTTPTANPLAGHSTAAAPLTLANPRVNTTSPVDTTTADNSASPADAAVTNNATSGPAINSPLSAASSTATYTPARYYNKWHNYTVEYPSYWYFWGMGQTETATFRTAFAQTEVTTTNALITIDIMAKTVDEIRDAYPSAKATSTTIASTPGWHLVLLNGTEIYLRELNDMTVVFTGVAREANVLANMVESFRPL